MSLAIVGGAYHEQQRDVDALWATADYYSEALLASSGPTVCLVSMDGVLAFT